jgi:HAD superfamily hydrolase (TIGR01459 family)
MLESMTGPKSFPTPAPGLVAHPPPLIISRARDLLMRYRVLYCDVWGVLHDGHKAFEAANDALIRFRDSGGTVVLVSNAPVPEHRVAAMLDLRGVSRDAWDAIVSSGAIALAHVAEKGYGSVHYIGPRDRDAAFFEKSPARPVPLAAAEALVCTGLENDETETAETYRPLLERARERELPFVCANPDLVVDVGGRHYVCAGALADLYEHLGGAVFWAGKPHASAYAAARGIAERIRDAEVSPAEILAIGDALRTDIKGAHGAGVDALFVASGIHRDDVMAAGAIDPLHLAGLFKPGAPPAVAAISSLRW